MKNTMTRPPAIYPLILCLAAGALSFMPAALSAAEAPATPAARLEAARSELATTRTNIVLTLEQLDLLRKAGDPHGQAQGFVDQLAAMKERAKLTQDRVHQMTARGDAYFAEWETETSAISDPEARKQAEAVRAQRKKTYDLIKLNLQQAGKNFTPLLAELEQIKTLLEGERSKEKIAEAKELFSQANWNCVSVQRALMNAEAQLDTLGATPGKGTPATGNQNQG